MNTNIKNISEWEVLTPTGWQDFDGIKKVNKDSSLRIQYKLPDNSIKEITCSKGHQFFVKRYEEEMFCFAEMLETNLDKILYEDNETFCEIISIETVDEDIDLYDLVNVSNGYEYIANNIVNHNCAHVEGIDDLWVSIQPTMNAGGSAILISSPSGVGSLFHKLWIGANTEKDENQEGTNGFYAIELPWTVHPERNQKWFDQQKAELIATSGERAVAQEYLCSFQSSGDTFVKGEAMDNIYKSIKTPENVQMFGRDEIWIWQAPVPNTKYIIAADVARGDGEDFSAFNIINSYTSEVVADFKGKPPPDKFAELLMTYGYLYNSALICQELNNVGVACAIKLKDSKYPNLYYEKFMKNMYMSYMTHDVGDEMPGFTTTANNRIEMLAKLENVIRNQQIKIYSKRMFQELQTFIWKGNKPQSQKGYNDDLVMSLALGCQMYEATANTNSYDSIENAMAMLRGMSKEVRTMNTMTGQQKTEVHKTSTGQEGPITAEVEKIKKDIQQKQNRMPVHPIYGSFKWLLDD